MVGEVGGGVVEPVALFGGEVASPVGDFDVPLEEGAGENWFGVFVADCDWVGSERGILEVS